MNKNTKIPEVVRVLYRNKTRGMKASITRIYRKCLKPELFGLTSETFTVQWVYDNQDDFRNTLLRQKRIGTRSVTATLDACLDAYKNPVEEPAPTILMETSFRVMEPGDVTITLMSDGLLKIMRQVDEMHRKGFELDLTKTGLVIPKESKKG